MQCDRGVLRWPVDAAPGRAAPPRADTAGPEGVLPHPPRRISKRGRSQTQCVTGPGCRVDSLAQAVPPIDVCTNSRDNDQPTAAALVAVEWEIKAKRWRAGTHSGTVKRARSLWAENHNRHRHGDEKSVQSDVTVQRHRLSPQRRWLHWQRRQRWLLRCQNRVRGAGGTPAP